MECSACHSFFAPSEWSAQELRNEKNQGSKLVCKTCRGKGCTADDPALHTCQLCRKELGSKRFQAEHLKDFKYHGYKKLWCASCMAAASNREKDLKAAFKRSTWFCKCGCMLHTERCPLSPRFYGERRWPGGDNCISKDDKDFLNKLNPRPTWWANALQKPK